MKRVKYLGGSGSRITIRDPFSYSYIDFVMGVFQDVSDELAERLDRHPDFLVMQHKLLKLWNSGQRDGLLLMKRFGAIGDLIQLYTLVRILKKEFRWQFDIQTRPEYIELCQQMGVFEHVYGETDQGPHGPYLGILQLNGSLEVDHQGLDYPEFVHHRTRLFYSNLLEGLPKMARKKQVELEWDIPSTARLAAYAKEFLMFFDERLPVVAIQYRGSGRFKSLPQEQMNMIIKDLARSYNVLVVEEYPDSVPVGPRIKSTGRLSILGVIELLKSVNLCICFDSGVLWMAHAACCPVLCLMGPTREPERLALHPLWPDGYVKAVRMERLVNCQPCFEKAEACKYAITCMAGVPTEPLLEEITASVQKLLALPVPDRTKKAILTTKELSTVSAPPLGVVS